MGQVPPRVPSEMSCYRMVAPGDPHRWEGWARSWGAGPIKRQGPWENNPRGPLAPFTDQAHSCLGAVPTSSPGWFLDVSATYAPSSALLFLRCHQHRPHHLPH